MRRMFFRPAAWLGWVGMLGLLSAGQALAESQPCGCSTDNQRVVSEYSCLVIRTEAGCNNGGSVGSAVRNSCSHPVTLVDWPLLRNASCESSPCTVELEPFEEVYFDFAGMSEQATSGLAEDTYRIAVDGQESTVTVSTEVTCTTFTAPEEEGCSSAPGTLAALGLLLLVGPVARRRRSPVGR
ncbi:MXAN_0125 family MYXO-CTERM protein [Pyxidicoccus sp. 3LFB2]